jgi:bud site selection protein 20
MPSGKSRQTGSGSSRKKIQKQKARGKFIERHIDQVFDDFLKDPSDVHDGKRGPVGTSTRYVSFCI